MEEDRSRLILRNFLEVSTCQNFNRARFGVQRRESYEERFLFFTYVTRPRKTKEISRMRSIDSMKYKRHKIMNYSRRTETKKLKKSWFDREIDFREAQGHSWSSSNLSNNHCNFVDARVELTFCCVKKNQCWKIRSGTANYVHFCWCRLTLTFPLVAISNRRPFLLTRINFNLGLLYILLFIPFSSSKN